MPKTNNQKIYQFKITLEDITPRIWRRIQVPQNYSLWDLHVAIQDSMGWKDEHLHEFRTIEKNRADEKSIGIPSEEDEMYEMNILAGWEEKISDWFSLDKRKTMKYIYDFGDNWHHKIILEKILPKKEKTKYPICIAGKRACPLEDCCGVGGYYNILEALKNPPDEENQELMDWVGEEYDPEKFEAGKVKFFDSAKRLDEMLKYN